MKKFFFHFFVFLSIFLFINFLLAFLWTPLSITKSKILKDKHYTDEMLLMVGIDTDNEENFYRETWRDKKFKYIQFAEHLEAKTKNQNYVNVTDEYGRKIKNDSNCNLRYFFYGDSQIFGYNVKDNQTIPAFFKEILIKNTSNKNNCVYNFGSANYFSTQENILFIKHILENKIKKNDFAIFLNGHIENGNQESQLSNKLSQSIDKFYYDRWERLKYSSITFFNSLPIIIIYKRLHNNFSQKVKNSSNTEDEVSSKLNNINETKNVFNKNIKIRNSICEIMNINCYTFIKPFPKIHGKPIKNFTKDETSHLKMKYLELIKNKSIIDISQVLNNKLEISYVDDEHFSPNSNKIIAQEIIKKINN